MLQLPKKTRDELVIYIMNSVPTRDTVGEASNLVSYLQQLEEVPVKKIRAKSKPTKL